MDATEILADSLIKNLFAFSLKLEEIATRVTDVLIFTQKKIEIKTEGVDKEGDTDNAEEGEEVVMEEVVELVMTEKIEEVEEVVMIDKIKEVEEVVMIIEEGDMIIEEAVIEVAQEEIVKTRKKKR